MVTKIQTESVSNLRNHYNLVLEKTQTGPVFVLQNSSLAAVIISPEEWNAIADHIEELEDIAAAWKAKYERAAGKADTETLSAEELAEWMGDAVPA